MTRLVRVALPAILAVTALAFAGHRIVTAADHLDPPARTDPNVDPTPDRAADIADIYAFHDADNLVLALTFGGPAATNVPAFYDRDVFYTLDISNGGSRADIELSIGIKFGFDGNNPGVLVTGLPGGPISGPVETNLRSGDIFVRAGLFDDPFFFDSQGLRESRQSGMLMFDNTRNFFGNQNITAVVIQLPRSIVENGDNPIDISSTTSRLGGQL